MYIKPSVGVRWQGHSSIWGEIRGLGKQILLAMDDGSTAQLRVPRINHTYICFIWAGMAVLNCRFIIAMVTGHIPTNHCKR